MRTLIFGGAAFAALNGALATAQVAHPFELSSLDGTNGATFLAEEAGDRIGEIVGGAGDVNGDGLEDFLITAFFGDTADAGNAGLVYLVYGKRREYGSSGLFGLGSFDPSTDGRLFAGAFPEQFAGFFASGAGDVNGDGFYDLLIGAPGFDNSRGEVYVIYGPTTDLPGRLIELNSLASGQALRITGKAQGHFLGLAVSGADDVNGDGLDDVLFSAPAVDGDRGEAYLIYGREGTLSPDGTIDLNNLDGTNGVAFKGLNAGDGVGRVLTSAGDVNGDGYSDILLNAWQLDRGGNPDSNEGGGYLIYGSPDGPGTNGTFDLAALDGDNGSLILGENPDDKVGRSMAGVGDFNGDGYGDVMMNARAADVPGTSRAGRAYILYGGEGGIGPGGLLDLQTLSGEEGTVIRNFQENAWLFNSGTAGDWNHDGLMDFMIGSILFDVDGKGDAGRVFVVHGNKEGLGDTFDLSVINGSNGLWMNGAGAKHEAGRFVSPAGDVNDDGRVDLLVGGSGDADDPSPVVAGRVHLVYGAGELGPASYSTYIQEGAQAPRPVGALPGGRASIPESRLWIGFDGGAGPGAEGASLATVEISFDSIFGQTGVESAPVQWDVSTGRTGWTQATLVLHYLSTEVLGLDESELTVFRRDGSNLVELSTVREPSRNRLLAETGQLGAFVIGPEELDATPTPTPTPPPITPTPTPFVSQREVLDNLLGKRSSTEFMDFNEDGAIDSADVVGLGQ